MGSIITKMAPTGKKKFLDLPQEIRNTVWECAVEPDALQPRVVEVRFGEYRLSKSHDFVADIPPILHACRDSRKIALKVSTPSVPAQSSPTVLALLQSALGNNCANK